MAEQPSEQSIFLHALGLAAPGERAAYLDGICRDRPGLRAEVEALLAAHDRLGGGPLPTVPAPTCDAGGGATVAGPGAAGAAGTVLAGRYKLLEPIGEGGMGAVWRAEQTAPVQRVVAVKLIRPGMDSKQVLARFEAERQALALMDHPNIAKVFDAGTAPDGRPFFVMELVEGVPITQYCDGHRLTPRQRLELLVPVCQAVQHAHQKGVIHRDLKPSNVLVALYDDKPVPKVIDFGVAKATGPQLAGQTLHTGFGAVVGTVEYMSPEQAGFHQLDVDTRSDVYTLGILLYELLTGGPPFSHQELERVGVLEMLRVIREREPARPSARLSTAEGLPTLAANRGTEPARLTKLVRGELDWIVMKALEKDRNRRYATANALAADVQHYLADEPVQACPPSAAYRFRKFARRHRAALVTALLVSAALLVGTAVSTWQAIRATTAEREAEASLLNARKAVDQMLTRVSTSRLKDVPQAYPVRKELLEDALGFYEEFARQRPSDPQLRLKKTQLLESLGKLQSRMGLGADADRSLRRAVEIAAELARDHPAPAAHREALANGHQSLAASLAFSPQTLRESGAEYRRALAHWDELANDFPADPKYRASRARCQWGLAKLLIQDPGKAGYDEAESLLRQATATDRGLAEEFPTDVVYTHRLMENALSLAELMDRKGQTRQAEEILKEASPDAKKFVAQAGSRENSRRILAKLLLQRGRLLSRLGQGDEGAELALQALELREQLASDFPEMTAHQRWLANILYTEVGVAQLPTQPQKAESALRKALAIYEQLAKVKPDDASTLRNRMLDCRRHLAAILFATSRRQEAEATWRQALADAEQLVRADPGRGHLIAELLKTWPDSPAADAERVYREALPLLDWLVEQAPTLAGRRYEANLYRRKLALILITSGRPEEAELLWRSALHFYDKLAAKYPDQPHYGYEVIRTRLDVAVQLFSQRRAAEAEPEFRQALKAGQELRAAFPGRADCRGELARGYSRFADLLAAGGRGKAAGDARRQALALWQTLAKESPRDANPWAELGSLHIHLGQWDEALTCLNTAVELKPDSSLARYFRGHVYAHLGQWDKAVAEQTKSLELNPNFWWAWYRRGQAHAARKQWDGAAADYQKAIELGGATDPWVWVSKAAAHAQLDEPEQAIADLRRAIAAGFRDAAHLKSWGELDGLRSRDDFKMLLAELERKKE